jgi:hypothetical protein
MQICPKSKFEIPTIWCTSCQTQNDEMKQSGSKYRCWALSNLIRICQSWMTNRTKTWKSWLNLEIDKVKFSKIPRLERSLPKPLLQIGFSNISAQHVLKLIFWITSMLRVKSNPQSKETEFSCSDFSDVYTIAKLDTKTFERCSSEIFLQNMHSTI